MLLFLDLSGPSSLSRKFPRVPWSIQSQVSDEHKQATTAGDIHPSSWGAEECARNRLCVGQYAAGLTRSQVVDVQRGRVRRPRRDEDMKLRLFYRKKGVQAITTCIGEDVYNVQKYNVYMYSICMCQRVATDLFE